MAIERWRPLGTAMAPWDRARTLSDLQSEMNRIFDSAFDRPRWAGERTWSPVCDVWETPDDVMVALELPGISERDVHLSAAGDMLTIKGERAFAGGVGSDVQWHGVERPYGRFERTLHLAIPVQPQKVTASYRAGVLTIRLPKSDDIKPKQVRIEVE